jgi:hypothetical protein
VEDVAVAGVPLREGETPIAFVVSWSASAEEIKGFVNAGPQAVRGLGA